jgi:small subunit ribosomal protein S4e
MGKKSGSNRLKRLSAPRQWDIPRKAHRFAIKPSPGPYSIENSYSLGVALRDLLDLVMNRREAEKVLYNSEILVDGVSRHDEAFPVGLFNVIEVPKEGLAFRLIPSPDGLAARKVSKDQAKLKLCRIRSKSKITGGHIQYGFHDGRSIRDDTLSLSPGDSVLLKVPEQSVVSSIKMTKGSLGMIVSGERAGEMGKITEVKKGTASRERMVAISLPGGDTEVPARMIFPVGAADTPAIEVQAQ